MAGFAGQTVTVEGAAPLVNTEQGRLSELVGENRIQNMPLNGRNIYDLVKLAPGAVVEVTQQIPHRDRVWTNRLKGTVISYQQKQTGSWFAHSKDDKLWLDRLVLRKDDGEITSLILDDYTRLEVITPAPEAKQPT